MFPILAIIGRPNVGKSTLFNRLTRSREALAAAHEGLTRDRIYGTGCYEGTSYALVDTGGLVFGNRDQIEEKIVHQTYCAIDEADGFLLIVDAHGGITPDDERIVQEVRRTSKPIWLVVNKIDGTREEMVFADFHNLHIGIPHLIAAKQNRGLNDLIDQVLSYFHSHDREHRFTKNTIQNIHKEHAEAHQDQDDVLKMAIVGRPNVGKSTLVNCLLGEDRVIAYDHAGTTRDSVSIPLQKGNDKYLIIDTAGIRRKGKTTQDIEKFSVVKALESIKKAHVVVLMLDGTDGLVDQDLHLLSQPIRAGKGIVIVVNKQDCLTAEQKKQVEHTIDRRLRFAAFVKTHFISAKKGTGIRTLYKLVQEVYRATQQQWNPSTLTQILESATKEHQPPIVGGRRRTKLRYCQMVQHNPMTLVIHGSQTDALPASYKKYLENRYRNALHLTGIPIHIRFKTTLNPFAGKKNTLNERQMKKRKRMLKHVKQK